MNANQPRCRVCGAPLAPAETAAYGGRCEVCWSVGAQDSSFSGRASFAERRGMGRIDVDLHGGYHERGRRVLKGGGL
jgi:hypothetical protein